MENILSLHVSVIEHPVVSKMWLEVETLHYICKGDQLSQNAMDCPRIMDKCPASQAEAIQDN